MFDYQRLIAWLIQLRTWVNWESSFQRQHKKILGTVAPLDKPKLPLFFCLTHWRAKFRSMCRVWNCWFMSYCAQKSLKGWDVINPKHSRKQMTTNKKKPWSHEYPIPAVSTPWKNIRQAGPIIRRLPSHFSLHGKEIWSPGGIQSPSGLRIF